MNCVNYKIICDVKTSGSFTVCQKQGTGKKKKKKEERKKENDFVNFTFLIDKLISFVLFSVAAI